MLYVVILVVLAAIDQITKQAYPFDLSVTDPEIYRQVSAWFTDLLRKS